MRVAEEAADNAKVTRRYVGESIRTSLVKSIEKLKISLIKMSIFVKSKMLVFAGCKNNYNREYENFDFFPKL